MKTALNTPYYDFRSIGQFYWIFQRKLEEIVTTLVKEMKLNSITSDNVL